MCHMGSDILMTFRFIRSQHNLGDWRSSTVVVFSGGCKILWFVINSDIVIERIFDV